MKLDTFWSPLNSQSLKPIIDKQVLVVIGGGKWDEWKWGDAYALATHGDYDLLVSSVGWPNAGHTVVSDDGKKFVWHNLPGSALTGKDTFLGQWKFISIEWLEKEISELRSLGVNSKIFVANSAQVLFGELHKKIDAAIESFKSTSGRSIGTTASWVGPWVAFRWLRTGINMKQLSLASNNDLPVYKDQILFWINAGELDIDIWKLTLDIIDQYVSLQDLLEREYIELVDDDFAQKYYKEGKKILIEWSQSPELGMFGWAYPNCTSTDTSFLWNLSPLWIIPVPDKVGQFLVIKAFPSAVWKHYFPERISHIFPELWEKEAIFWKETGEYGATTGRARMVALPSLWVLESYLQQNSDYIEAVSIRKFDVLSQFEKIIGLPKLPIVTWYKVDWEPLIEYINYDIWLLIERYQEVLRKSIVSRQIPLIAWFWPEPKQSRIIYQ